MFNWGVGVILAHHGDTSNYKKKLVAAYALNNTKWPKYPTNNSILKVKKHKNTMPACEIHSVKNGK